MTPDEQLFREWQLGSAGALEALVRRYHTPLLAHLVRLTGDTQAAEDLVQETFLRLVREARSYRYPRPFAPWLYTIARNLARNQWQSAYHRRVDRGGAVPAETAAPDPDPAEWLERLERRQGVLAALAGLSFEQREVLSLRYGQELSVEEAAQVLGVPAGTVKSRAFTALHRLRDRLGQGGASSDRIRGGRSHG